MRKIVCMFVLALSAAVGHAQSAQPERLRIDHLDKLASKAVQIVDVTLDEALLKLASKFLSPTRSADEAKIKELVGGLKGVYVKRFEFEQDNQYSESDVEPLRAQLKSPAWARIVGVRTKRGGQNVDVYLMSEGQNIKGISVLVTAARELTVVNILGPIDIDKLSQLEGQFGIPRMEISRPEAIKP